MLSVMERTPERLVAPSAAECAGRISLDGPLNVVFGGVGGSGIVGDVLSDYCRDALQIPVAVCRSVRIPHFVGEKTLFIAISYSGETTETLGMLKQVRQTGATLAAVCSGGKLLNTAQALGIPYVKVPAVMVPRLALPELLAATSHLLAEANIVKDYHTLLEEARKSVSEQINGVKVSVGLGQNMAKQMATTLAHRLPLLIGSEEDACVLRRFKNELNENSKVPAFCYTLPEAYHDDVEGLRVLEQLSRPQPILLRAQRETEAEERTRKKLVEQLLELGFPPAFHFTGMGEDRLGWLVSAIMFGDYAATYLSILRGVDPTELFLIPGFRAIRGQV
jgi:glucose/mannose-6-phosphate isomerase